MKKTIELMRQVANGLRAYSPESKYLCERAKELEERATFIERGHFTVKFEVATEIEVDDETDKA